MKARQRFVYAATAIILAVLKAGCGTKLVVSGPGGTDGVPFKVPETYVADAIYMKSKSAKECTPLPFRKFVSLPTGAVYHARPDSKPFSKSEFTIELNSNGALEKIVFNADPEFTEAIDSTAGLVTAVAGIVRPPTAPPSPAEEGFVQTDQPPSDESMALPAPVEKLIQDALKGKELTEETRAALQKILETAKPHPPCDTGERITCIQPLAVGKVIKECGTS